MHSSNFRTHLEEILNYWRPAVDHENGGIFVNMEPVRRRIADPGYKGLLMHARQLYNYSVGWEAGDIPGAEEIARALFGSLETLFTPENGYYPSYIHSTFYPGPAQSAYHGTVSTAYNHCYVITAYARYAKASDDEDAYLKAMKVMKDTLSLYNAGPVSENGIFSVYNGEECREKSGNVQLHYHEALLNLYRAHGVVKNQHERDIIKRELLQKLAESRQLFLTKLYDPETCLTPDFLHEDLSFKKFRTQTTLGHPLEWWGFLCEEQLLTGVTIPFLREEGLRLLERCLELGLSETGCFRATYVFDTGHVPGTTDFWTQIEAILTMCYAGHHLNDEGYFSKAEQMWNFYTRFMKDTANGGIYQEVAEDGALLSIQKGSFWKCDHHALRVCERVIEYGLLQQYNG